MKILLTSDTHTFQDEISQEWLVEADVICHSGDFCLKGTFEEGLAFYGVVQKIYHTNTRFSLQETTIYALMKLTINVLTSEQDIKIIMVNTLKISEKKSLRV